MHEVAITDLYVDEAVWPEGAAAELREFLTGRYSPDTDPILTVTRGYMLTQTRTGRRRRIKNLIGWEQDEPTLFQAVYGRSMTSAELERAHTHRRLGDEQYICLAEEAPSPGLCAAFVRDLCGACLQATEENATRGETSDIIAGLVLRLGMPVEDAHHICGSRHPVTGLSYVRLCSTCQKKLRGHLKQTADRDGALAYRRPIEANEIPPQPMAARAGVEAGHTPKITKCTHCGCVTLPTEQAAAAALTELWVELQPQPGQDTPAAPFVYQCERGDGWHVTW